MVVVVVVLCRGVAKAREGRGGTGQRGGAMARQTVERRLCWVLVAAMLAMGASAVCHCLSCAGSIRREPDRA